MDRRCFAGALVLLAVAAGCGGDDDEDAAPAASTASTATTASGAATTATTATTASGAATTATTAAGGAPAQPTCQPVGDIAQAATTVAYELNEFSFNGPASAPAGEVGFQLTNVGRANHEMAIIRGDSYEALPKNEHGTVDEATLPAGAKIGEVGRFPGGGQTCSGVFDLDPGNYVIICNIEFQNGPQVVSHAGRGMVQSFEVTA